MDPLIYSVVHVVAGFLLVAYTFQAFANPERGRRTTLTMTGICALLMLVAGFGSLAKLNLGFPGWVVVKLVCWLVLAAMAGLAYRRPALRGLLRVVTIGVVIVAAYMVYFRPL
jgi:hypothetical protein